jgi:hypothetical protein
MTEYKYQYFQFNGESKINTDWGHDLSEIKNTVHKQDSGLIIRDSVYPNGFKIRFEQSADSIIVHTNMPLEDIGNDTFKVNLV